MMAAAGPNRGSAQLKIASIAKSPYGQLGCIYLRLAMYIVLRKYDIKDVMSW